ncbi:MAG: hypothetical protein IPJ81_13105 [Chitinophagaceae bacterium]|nr:hypothetical protein [Chitinophagaceae bacterium]
MKKILIPTDFTVKSLILVRETIEQATEEKIQIVLVHGIQPPSSITELLFFSKSKLINSLQTEEFINACKLIKSKYQSRISSMYVDIIMGNNRSYFHNYLTGNQIDEIYFPLNYKMAVKHPLSFDIIHLLKKCPIKSTALDCLQNPVNINAETEQISDLFFTKLQTVNLHEA